MELGNIEISEMYKTFNMGLGFSVVCGNKDVDDALDILETEAKVIGKIEEGTGIEFNGMYF